MSNFTKSILYSTTVMVVGLVGVFTIYNNMTASNDASSVANIAPAAGNSDLGVNFGEALDNADYVFEGTKSNAAEIMESSARALNDMISAAGGEVSETIGDAVAVKEEVTETIDGTTETLEETVDVTNETADKTTDISVDATDKTAETVDKTAGEVVNATEPAAADAAHDDATKMMHH